MLILAAPLWGLMIAGALQGWDWRVMSVVHDAAVCAIVLAGAWWGIAWLHDGQQRALIRQNGDLYERAPKDARPRLLERVR